MIRLLTVVLAASIVTGCASTEQPVRVDRSQLKTMVANARADGFVNWLYLGSDDQDHHLVRQYPISLVLSPFRKPCRLVIARQELEIPDPMLLTNRSGRPIFRRFKKTAEGFTDIVFDFEYLAPDDQQRGPP